MSDTVEIKREALERLVNECSEAWRMYYESPESHDIECELADKLLGQAITYQTILEYITGSEWYYNSADECIMPA